jgi:hypothetical protein
MAKVPIRCGVLGEMGYPDKFITHRHLAVAVRKAVDKFDVVHYKHDMFW